MKINKAKVSDQKQIAELHKQGIPSGFISSLNIKVVQKLYKTIILNEIIFVVEANGKIVGFVSCAIQTGKLYKDFIKANSFSVLPYFILKVFSISFIRKTLETLKAPKKTKKDNREDEMPELLSIVIDASQQAKGIGKILLDALEKELIKRNIPEYKVVAGDNLLSANKFYQKYGFELSHKIELHKGQISNVYSKNI